MSIESLIEKSKEFQFSDEEMNESENLRKAFVEKFPREKINELTIDQYVQGTDEESFCYWLEFKKFLFGIGGGSAVKFGIYKANDGKYYDEVKKTKKPLVGEELNKRFKTIINGICAALELVENNKVEQIKEIQSPIWNMVLQKILSIYYPDKFLTIGKSEVLIECARDVNLKNVDLEAANSIQINYECKKLLSELPEFKNWSYLKIGRFAWEFYLDDATRGYYIIGSKYGGNKDVFPQMLEKSVIATNFSPPRNLEKYYLKSSAEITAYLKELGGVGDGVNLST